MLDKRQFIIFAVLAAIIGGCTTVGVVVMGTIVYALMQGDIEPSWVPRAFFGLFALGAGCSIGLLFHAASKFQKELLKKIGSDK